MASNPLGPALLNLPKAAALPDGLLAGRALQTVVRGSPEQPFLLLGGAKLPLGEGLAPGTRVLVNLVREGGQSQLQVQPQPLAAPAAEAGIPRPQSPLAPVLQEMAALLQRDDLPALAPRLIPANLPRTRAALERFFSLFTSRSALGGDLESLAGLLREASSAGALPQETAQRFAGMLSRLDAASASDFKVLLQQMRAEQPVETRLAQLLNRNALQPDQVMRALQADLRGLVAGLRAEDALWAYMRGRRQLRRFEELLGRVHERLEAVDAGNVRGLEQQYKMIELPFSPQHPLSETQIHLFGEGGGRGARRSREATAVVDCHTSLLGDLWIRLDARSDTCRCRLRVTSEEVAGLFQEHADDLAQRLRETGYQQAAVEVDVWDGDRLREAAETLAVPRPLDLIG